MKNIFKSPWTYAAIILVIFGAVYGYNNIAARANGPGEHDKFAQYLTEQGVIMYGTEWCPHCKNNKALFGRSFQYINYIDCDKNRQVCTDAGIRGYPTWEINGIMNPGEQSLERLAQLTGYEGEL